MGNTKTTGPYDRTFEQHLTDNGIFLDGYVYPDGRDPPEPKNLEDILQALATPRASLDRLSSEDFRKFVRADCQARREIDVMKNVIPVLDGDIQDHKCVTGSIQFKNLHQLTDGSLVAGNPVEFYGANPEQLHQEVRDRIGDFIVPSTQKDVPIAPSFFLEAKGPGGSPAVARLQVCYDGALGARGIHNLRVYGSPGLHNYDNNAYTITATYQAGVLKLYTSHPIYVSAERTEFIMMPLMIIALAADLASFRRGLAAYLNAINWTKGKRDHSIEQANRRVAQGPSTPGDSSGSSLSTEAGSEACSEASSGANGDQGMIWSLGSSALAQG
ncbi:hypothetical protein QQZ08_006768 [Neonectria magnoliae]|uniref:Uncharacterized protein n=1 Tax=Neonectria magnoliae TaxID=2732573 RepID=A0ABR1HZZ0_9HYPO